MTQPHFEKNCANVSIQVALLYSASGIFFLEKKRNFTLCQSKPMQYSIQQIAEIMGGKFLNDSPADATIEHILLDSRQVTFPASSLFVALKGRQRDGHEFLEQLQATGVKNFLISRPPTRNSLSAEQAGKLKTQNFILVNDTLEALQLLAAHHRRQFDIPVIGITGSNGKTIVKEWLFQLLREDYHIVRSPKSYNSQLGVPLSVLQMKPGHELAIFEAGISQMGEMEKLEKIIAPTIGVFTNLGEAHSEGFPSLEAKLSEKWRLFENCEVVVSPQSAVHSLQAAADGSKKLTWSTDGADADLMVSKIDVLNSKAVIRADCRLRTVDCGLNYSDTASIENAITCWAVMLQLGYSQEVIAERMAKLEPVAMRLELKEAMNNCQVINDSYNSDLTSLKIALDFLEQQGKTLKRTLVLSDILQSGQVPEQLYGAVAKLLLRKKIGRLIGIGEEVVLLDDILPIGYQKHFFPDTNSFLEKFPDFDFQNETILLKGARKFGFERIANRLATKVHKTTLEVNLTALLNNLRVYQSYLQPGTKLMVMVKARAYGSGSLEVAKLLEFQHVDYLGVAYADEGVELRKAGVQLPIIVLNPEEATFDSLVRYRLEPEIYSLDLLEKFVRFIDNQPSESSNLSEGCPAVHLKLDTGMHRLGFEENDIDGLLLRITSLKSRITIRTIFSHLAASESPMHDDFTRQQIACFQKMYERIASSIGYRPMRHILNSSGIVRFPEFQMEMVRLGIGLYGVGSGKEERQRLLTVNTLKATVSQVKKIKPGETVGYGRVGQATVEMRIATVSIGYADGLLRRAGNGRFSVLIRGQRAPLFGNVCMDMVMADVTHIPGVQVGDEVVVFGKSADGKELPVQELADCLDTIPYEIFTSISGRVKRVYVQE